MERTIVLYKVKGCPVTRNHGFIQIEVGHITNINFLLLLYLFPKKYIYVYECILTRPCFSLYSHFHYNYSFLLRSFVVRNRSGRITLEMCIVQYTRLWQRIVDYNLFWSVLVVLYKVQDYRKVQGGILIFITTSKFDSYSLPISCRYIGS